MNALSQTAQFYDRLRSAILALELAPGERLTERGLEATFAASRTPVRAALSRLDSEGLVKRDGRGWIVSPIDLGEIRALAELREAVEVAAAKLAVHRASDDEIARLAVALEAARPAADADEGLRAGDDFHVSLALLSGNQAMVDVVRGAMTRLARTRWLEVRTAEAREIAWLEHRAVVAAVATRDADEAGRLLTAHIRGTNERLLDSLSTERHRFHGLAFVAE